MESARRVKSDGLRPVIRRTLLTFPALLAIGVAPLLGAEPFEKVGSEPGTLSSPTSIPYTVPAASRAAGWTIAALQSRLGLAGSNPAFLGNTTARSDAIGAAPIRWEVAIDGLYQVEDIDCCIDQHETRFSAAAGKFALGRLAVGLAYEHPYHAENEILRTVFRLDRSFDEDFESLLGGAAFAVSSGVIVGGAIAWQRTTLYEEQFDAYQATVGAEVDLSTVTLAAAIKTEPFGEDSDRIVAPSWMLLDARVPLGSTWALGTRFATGWWNDTRDGALDSPLDAGAGFSAQVLPTLQLLVGVHHIRDRVDVDSSTVFSLGQGTFLDGGLVLGLGPTHVALSIEDSHVFDAPAPSTWVTLSANAAF